MATTSEYAMGQTAPLLSSLRELTPIKVWSIMGALFIGVWAWSMGNWLMAPSFAPAPNGDAVIPAMELTFLRVFEGASIIAGLLFIWYCLIRPWRRTGSITFDGMLVIAFFLMWWQDPMTNFIAPTWWYNGYLFNMSSWANFIPFWSSPNHQNFVEPIFLMGFCYVWFFVGPTIFGSYILRSMRAKYTNLSMLQIFVIMFLSVALFDAIIEIYFIRTGAGAYPGVIHSLSLWGGTPYQWPLYEGFIMGWTLMTFAALRYYRDDKGNSFAERGVEKLAISKKAKTSVRLLSIIGITHTIYLVLYFLPWNLFAMHIDTHTPMPSYMRHEICGTGTEYACPSKYVPLQTKTSIPIAPDDPRLPTEVLENQDGPPYSMFAPQ